MIKKNLKIGNSQREIAKILKRDRRNIDRKIEGNFILMSYSSKMA